MDLRDDDDALSKINKDKLEVPYINEPRGEDHPGTLYVKLITYEGKSIAANKMSTFSFGFATLGEFVDFLVVKKPHTMSFLGYGEAWKGCRDFITQSFMQPRLANKVTGSTSCEVFSM